MDYILILLFNIIAIFLLNLKNYKKIKKYIYLVSIITIIVFITLFFYKNKHNHKQHFKQNGGFNKINKIDKLKDTCGLPKNYNQTGHCFADGTHQTCCMLGPQARKYADETGNPIGKASEEAFFIKYGRTPLKNELTSWCTCFGSKVCSFYANKFKDGTHIRFVNNPKSNTHIVKDISPKCEGYFKDKFSIKSHLTPGIAQNHSVKSKYLSKICEKSKVTSI